MPNIKTFDLSNEASDLGGAAHDLFQGIGDFQAADSYTTSAQYARTNAQLEQESLDIKQAQTQREIYQTIGGQKSDVAAAGFSASGSALDLLRDSSAQGALVKEQNLVQGNIAISSAQGQAASADQQAAASKTSGIGDFIGSALSVGAALLPLLFLL